MTEVIDYYSLGLDRSAGWEELKKQVQKKYEQWRQRANRTAPGSEEAGKRDFWAKALAIFKDDASRKAYDASLDTWQKSSEAQEAKARARAEAERFVQQNSGVLELVRKAWSELDAGNVHEGILLGGKAAKLDPGSWEAYLVLGIAYFRWNDLDEAMSCLKNASRLNPTNADIYAALGELYERQERWKESFEQYRRAAAIDPDNIAHQVAMGLICVRAELPDEGIEILRRCQVKDPNDKGLQWVLGIALAESARLGWTYVPNGHPRVPEGWYAMSRQQALQAVEKLHEASTLKIEDQEMAKELARLKSDVDSNVLRKFTGSWFLFGLLCLIAVVGLNDNVGAGMLFALFAAAYYAVNLEPQYSVNARVLKGDHIIKQSIMNMIDNIQNGWVKLAVQLALFMLLPIFMIFWGIRNWTGANAPLGSAVSAARKETAAADALPDRPPLLSEEASRPRDEASLSPPVPVAERGGASGAQSATSAAASAPPSAPARVVAAAPVLAFIKPTATGQPNRMMLIGGGAALALAVLAGVGGYLHKSRSEEELRVALQQKTKMLQEAEQRARDTSEQSNRQKQQMQKMQAERDWPARAATETQPMEPSPPDLRANSGDRMLQPVQQFGDKYTYETIDHVDPRLNNVVTRQIMSINGSECPSSVSCVSMKFTNEKSKYERWLSYDMNLGLIKTRSGKGDGSDFNPPIQYFTFPGAVGERWTASSTETNIKTGKVRYHKLDGRIVGIETVSVPAGTFRTFKITVDSEVTEDGKKITGSDTSWYAPDVRRTVRSELESRELESGKVGRRSVNLISYSIKP